MPVVRDLRVLLRLADFRRLLTVRLLSQAADGVYQVALATYVVFSPEQQTSPAAIASAMAVLLLPYSLVGPFAGVLLDRWRRRQVFLYGNLLRALLACCTALLILASVPDWLFYASALTVTAVNRFVLAGLSAALPRVVDSEHLVMANSVSPTAGTLAATAGGGLAFLVRLVASDSDAAVVLLGAALYLGSALASLRMGKELLGPDPDVVQPRLGAAIASTARGLLEGLRYLNQRPAATHALAAMTLMRFCYGALTVMVLMLCRYAWSTDESAGLALDRKARPVRMDGRLRGGRRGPCACSCASLQARSDAWRGIPARARDPGGEDRDRHGGADLRGRRLPWPGLRPLRRPVQCCLRRRGRRRRSDASP
jgi:MFS family permease